MKFKLSPRELLLLLPDNWGCFMVKILSTVISRPIILTYHLQPFKKFSGWLLNSDQEPLRNRGSWEKL